MGRGDWAEGEMGGGGRTGHKERWDGERGLGTRGGSVVRKNDMWLHFSTGTG